VGFVVSGCVYVWFLWCVVVCIFGVCNERVCIFGFVKCGCVYMWVF